MLDVEHYDDGMTTAPTLFDEVEAAIGVVVLTLTAIIAERDGGTTYVIQSADQEIRMFVTVVAGGRHGAIVHIIGGLAGAAMHGFVQFTALTAADSVRRFAVGDAVTGYLAELAAKHTGFDVAA